VLFPSFNDIKEEILFFDYSITMQRRPLASQEPAIKDVWSARITPRKWRTFTPARSVLPSRLYGPARVVKRNIWTGKYFIPEGSAPALPHRQNYVLESEIARTTGGRSYRILYAVAGPTGEWIIRSKPTIEDRPGQLNLVLTGNNVVLGVAWF
jgi:hypothetical protein